MVTVHIHRDFKIYHNHLIFLILGDHAKVRRANIFAYKTERVKAKTKAIIKKIVNIPFLESPAFI